MIAFEVRAPRRDEAVAIAGVHVAAWRETYSALLPGGYLDAAHERMRRDMWERILDRADPVHRVRVAAVDGRLIGFGMAGAPLPDASGRPPRERQLYTLYVLAEAHGTGVGQALLDAVLGAEPALLWVAAENPRAIAFYRRNGFAFDGTTLTDPALPALVEARMVR